jgi:hypothetical protein
MFKKWFKKPVEEDFVLVRVCIGCVLPHNAKLIGHGTYTLIGSKGKTTEQYYDYEIKEADLDDFLKANSSLLIRYQLLDVEQNEKLDDTNPVKPTTIRGWTKKE